MTNQPAPEKCCPTCGSEIREVRLCLDVLCRSNHTLRVASAYGHQKRPCTDPWHGVLPVEPQPVGEDKNVDENFGSAVGALAMGRSYVGDVATQKVAIETVPVVPPSQGVCAKCDKPKFGPTSTIASGAVQNIQQWYCCCGETYNGVVPQGAEQFDKFWRSWLTSPGERSMSDHHYVGYYAEHAPDHLRRLCEAHAAASQAELKAKLEAAYTITGGKCGACGVDMNEVCELKAKIAELQEESVGMQQAYLGKCDDLRDAEKYVAKAERERDQAREALRDLFKQLQLVEQGEGVEFNLRNIVRDLRKALDGKRNAYRVHPPPDCPACVAPNHGYAYSDAHVSGTRQHPHGDLDLNLASEDASATPQFKPADAVHRIAHWLACASDLFDGEAFGSRLEHIAQTIYYELNKDRVAEPAAQPAPNDQAHAPDNPVHIGVAIEQARIGQCADQLHTLCGLCVTGDCMEGIDSCENDACECMDCGGKSGLGFKLKKRYAAAQLAGKQPKPDSFDYYRGKLEQFLRMKGRRPIDPTYWDMHEERTLRECLARAESLLKKEGLEP